MGSRLITDRFEWEQLVTKLATSPYHHPGWSWSAVRRIMKQTSKPLSCGYLRIWRDETLIGCPVIVLDKELFNTPRSWPQTLSGPKITDRAMAGIVTATVADVVLRNDEAQLVAIRSVARRLDRLSADTRSFRSITGADRDAMAASVTWSDKKRRDTWLNGIEELDRTSWDVQFNRHLDAHRDIIGWSATVTLRGRPETATVVAALQVGVEPPEWTSPR